MKPTSLPADSLILLFQSHHRHQIGQARHTIGRAELSQMKPTAILINTARGPIVDEKALVQALEEGTIAGAGLDVFENEPAVEPALRPALPCRSGCRSSLPHFSLQERALILAHMTFAS